MPFGASLAIQHCQSPRPSPRWAPPCATRRHPADRERTTASSRAPSFSRIHAKQTLATKTCALREPQGRDVLRGDEHLEATEAERSERPSASSRNVLGRDPAATRRRDDPAAELAYPMFAEHRYDLGLQVGVVSRVATANSRTVTIDVSVREVSRATSNVVGRFVVAATVTWGAVYGRRARRRRRNEVTIPVAVSKEDSGSVVVATRDDSSRAIATLDGLVLLAGFIAGCGLRWWVLRSRLGYLDLDEATVGLQARWFSNRPMVFFPGQAYGGTLETMLVWILHGISADGPIAMKLVPSLLHLVAAVIVWRIALRLIDSRAGQLAAPILLWCGSGWTVWQSTKERGFYGVGIVLATLLVLLAMRFVESDATGDALAFGIVIGLAVWTTPLLVLVALPCCAWMAVQRPSVIRKLPVIAAAAARWRVALVGVERAPRLRIIRTESSVRYPACRPRAKRR